MSNSSSKRKLFTDTSLENFASYKLVSPSGLTLFENVEPHNNYSRSYTNIKGEIFNVGGGQCFVSETEFVRDYGSYTITPQNNFTAWVMLWGAGGGGSDSSGGNHGGGGGFTRGLVDFEKDVPYTIVIGEGGQQSNSSTHGGGGRGHSGGGNGGGLSGLFYNSSVNSRAAWNHTKNPPVKRENALLVAGGGGGKGHHANANVGGGGGGGGWVGRNAHNANGGGQFTNGHAGYNNGGNNAGGHEMHGGHAYQASSWQGGGGGGWYGGGGGGHTSTHHNGGGGGSGHHAHPAEYGVQPNNWLSKFIRSAHTLSSPSAYHYAAGTPANYLNPYCYSAGTGGYAVGKGGYVNDSTNGSRHGKVVINFVPGYLANAIKSQNFEKRVPSQAPSEGEFRYDTV